MISSIKTKGFKGFDINESLAQKTIYTGKNTAGKSARSAAIALTILGFIPFAAKTNKKPSDILCDFGNGKTMTTAIISDGVEFERKFTRSKKGTVSQIMRVDKKKHSNGDFQLELFKAGNPRIVDLNDFISLSDAKKIDSLFALYPPGADLKNLDSDIEKSKKRISVLEESNRTATGVIQRLTESKANIVLPAGTMAEVTAKIATLTAGVKESQKALKIAEIKIAEDAAVKKAMEKQEGSQAKSDQMMKDNTTPFPSEKDQAVKDENRTLENNVNSNQSFANNDKNIPKTFHDPAESIQKIIDTMAKTDCQLCAAGIVAKLELRKYKVK